MELALLGYHLALDVRVQAFHFGLDWLDFLMDVKVFTLSRCHTTHFFVFFHDLNVAFFALIDLRFELALFLDQLLFFGPFIVDAVFNLVPPGLVSLEERRVEAVLMAEIVTRSRHHRLKSALLHFFELLINFGLQALSFHGFVASQSRLVEVL